MAGTRRSPAVAVALAVSATGGLILTVVLAVVGHVDADPAYNPVSLTVSDYAVSDRGGPVDAAMVTLGVASLALLAARENEVAVAIVGGHGELFIQQFAAAEPISDLKNLPPSEAAATTSTALVIGSGAQLLVEARGWGEARDALPSASNALMLPESLRTLRAKPRYARAPDARALEPA